MQDLLQVQVRTDGMLLSGIVSSPAMTGSTITIQFASSPGGWVDIKETDESALSYTVNRFNKS